MLKLIEPMLNVYTYLNKDLLYAATILHDISKIDEMTGVDGEYTKEGVLIGHLVMGSIEVEMSALKLGYQDTEEVLLLKHLILFSPWAINIWISKNLKLLKHYYCGSLTQWILNSENLEMN